VVLILLSYVSFVPGLYLRQSGDGSIISVLLGGIFSEKLVIVVFFCLVEVSSDLLKFFVVFVLGLRMIGVEPVAVAGMLNTCGAGIFTLLLDGRIKV